MLKRVFIILIFALASHFQGISQIILDENEVNSDTLVLKPSFKDTTHFTRLLLIPFESTMYTSDADKELMKASKLNYTEMVYRFRFALMVFLKKNISNYFETQSLLDLQETDSVDYLSKVYQCIGYKSISHDLIPNFLKIEDHKNITNGQLTVRENKNEKFTKTVITNKSILELLKDKLGFDMYIFIGMFEIKNDLSDYTEVGTNNYKRSLKVHYSIINSKGKNIGGNIATATFSSKINKVDEIIKKTFPAISEQILIQSPQPRTIKKNKKLNKHERDSIH